MPRRRKVKEELVPLPKPKPQEELTVKVGRLERESEIIRVLTIGVIVVFFVSFLGFVIDAFLYRADAYKEFNRTLDAQYQFIKEETSERKAILEDLESVKEVLNLQN